MERPHSAEWQDPDEPLTPAQVRRLLRNVALVGGIAGAVVGAVLFVFYGGLAVLGREAIRNRRLQKRAENEVP